MRHEKVDKRQPFRPHVCHSLGSLARFSRPLIACASSVSAQCKIFISEKVNDNRPVLASADPHAVEEGGVGCVCGRGGGGGGGARVTRHAGRYHHEHVLVDLLL